MKPIFAGTKALAVFLFALTFSILPAKEKNTWIYHYSKGRALLKAGKIKAASDIILKAYKEAKASKSLSIERENKILKDLGWAYRKLGKSKEYERIKRRSKELRKLPSQRPKKRDDLQARKKSSEKPKIKRTNVLPTSSQSKAKLSEYLDQTVAFFKTKEFSKAQQKLRNILKLSGFRSASWYDRSDTRDFLHICYLNLKASDLEIRKNLDALLVIYREKPDQEPLRTALRCKRRLRLQPRGPRSTDLWVKSKPWFRDRRLALLPKRRWT